MTYYLNNWFDDHSLIIFGFFIGFILVCGGIFVYNAVNIQQNMYEQCLLDGKKDYECYSMIIKRGR